MLPQVRHAGGSSALVDSIAEHLSVDAVGSFSAAELLTALAVVLTVPVEYICCC